MNMEAGYMQHALLQPKGLVQFERGNHGSTRVRSSTKEFSQFSSFSQTASKIGSILKPAVLAALGGSLAFRRARRREAKLVRTRVLAGFDVEGWRRGFFEPQETEKGFYFLENVDLPADLCGTFFRNGPGKFKAGNDMVMHQLDGDGLVLAISFNPEEKQVCVRHRLVQTQGLLRDMYAKRMFAKGCHGTPPGEGGLGIDPRKNVPKHTANATMMHWEDKLLAVGQFGKPFEVDPACLGTILGNEDEGSWNIDGALGEAGIGSFPKVCGTEECLGLARQDAKIVLYVLLLVVVVCWLVGLLLFCFCLQVAGAVTEVFDLHHPNAICSKHDGALLGVCTRCMEASLSKCTTD